MLKFRGRGRHRPHCAKTAGPADVLGPTCRRRSSKANLRFLSDLRPHDPASYELVGSSIEEQQPADMNGVAVADGSQAV